MADQKNLETEAKRVLADVPDRRDRGWRGLAADNSEKVAFAGVLGAAVLLVGVTVLFGLPGLLLTFLALTFVCFGALILIAMGS